VDSQLINPKKWVIHRSSHRKILKVHVNPLKLNGVKAFGLVYYLWKTRRVYLAYKSGKKCYFVWTSGKI